MAIFGRHFQDDMAAVYDQQLEHAALAVLRAGPAVGKAEADTARKDARP